MAKMSNTFPEGLKYTPLYDTTVFIGQAIHAVYVTLGEAGVLVLIVIVIFLQNFRAMLVPATTVPVTIIGAFAAMALLGFSVNLMTLFALILAIGIVVDDAIVIVENCTHYIEEGESPRTRLSRLWASSPAPSLASPWFLLQFSCRLFPARYHRTDVSPVRTGDRVDRTYQRRQRPHAKPTQCALYLRPRPKDYKPNWFYSEFNRGFAAVQDRYIGLVSWMVARPFTMVAGFFAVLFMVGFAFSIYPTSLLPLEDQGYCIISAELPEGSAQPRVKRGLRQD